MATGTPPRRARKLSARVGNDVWLKREDTQPVFSFKLRSAYNKTSRLPPEQLACGVICASAGNHAQGVALSARRLGCRAVIVTPVTTPRLKLDAVRAVGEAAKKVGGPCTIVSDHEGMVGIAQRGMTPRMRKPLREELDAAAASKDVQFEWRKRDRSLGSRLAQGYFIVQAVYS